MPQRPEKLFSDLAPKCRVSYSISYTYAGECQLTVRDFNCVPNLLVLAGGSEELWENNVLVVARLLHRADRRVAASEYFREGTIDAVADVCPYLLSQPFGSEYLLGNTVHAVADLLHGTALRAGASEYFREGTNDAVA